MKDKRRQMGKKEMKRKEDQEKKEREERRGRKEGRSARVVCACVVPWRALLYSSVWLSFLRAGSLMSHVTWASMARRFPSLRGWLSMNPAARTVTVPLPESHEHEVPSLSLSLESYVYQVAPRTCVKCPRASLREGVTLRRLPAGAG